MQDESIKGLPWGKSEIVCAAEHAGMPFEEAVSLITQYVTAQNCWGSARVFLSQFTGEQPRGFIAGSNGALHRYGNRAPDPELFTTLCTVWNDCLPKNQSDRESVLRQLLHNGFNLMTISDALATRMINTGDSHVLNRVRYMFADIVRDPSSFTNMEAFVSELISES